VNLAVPRDDGLVTEEHDDEADDGEVSEPRPKRTIGVEFLGDMGALNPFRNIPAALIGGASPQFQAQQAAIASTMKKIAEADRERHEEMDRLTVASAEAWHAPERARIQREIQTLELQGQIAETQRALLGQQIRQASEARQDRRIQYAVLAVALLTLVATLATSMASDSRWWVTALVAGAVLVATSAAAARYVRGPKEQTPQL
jgi:hypothetical protein